MTDTAVLAGTRKETGSPPAAALKALAFFGGGTGGHLFPGLAVAERARERCPDCDIVFFRTRRDVEEKVFANSGFRTELLDLSPPSGGAGAMVKYSLQSLRAIPMIRKALTRSYDAAIGLGGYASLPGIVAARHVGLPVVLLEQNQIPGKVNRFAAPFVDLVTTTPDQLVPGGEVVSGGHEARPQLVFQFVTQGAVLGHLDEIALLEGIFLIVEELPGTFKGTGVAIAPGTQAAVFTTTLGPGPLAEGTGAGDQGVVVLELALAADDIGKIFPLHAPGNLHARQIEEGGHDVRRVDGRLESARLHLEGGGTAHEERDADGLVPGPLLLQLSPRVQHVAVVRSVDQNGVLQLAALLEGLDKPADAFVERTTVGVVAGVGGLGLPAQLRRHVLPQGEFPAVVAVNPLGGAGSVGSVRGPPREEEAKGFSALGRLGRVVPDVGHRVSGLGVGVVIFPHFGLLSRFVVVAGLVVVVRALKHLPVVEALAPFGGDIS